MGLHEMAEREKRLGRGLESLISSAREKTLNVDLIRKSGHRVQQVAVESLEPNPFQPRRDFSVESLNELVESLRSHGLLQPIIVRRTEGGTYQLIAGERRWRASRELGWETIDAVVVEADDSRMLIWALIENVQREQLGPLELANAYQEMSVRLQMSHDSIAQAVGKSRPTITNHLRLLDLPEPVRERVSRGTVSMGAARALLSIVDRNEQVKLSEMVERGLLNVRQLEAISQKTAVSPQPESLSQPDPNLVAIVEELQELLSTKVQVKGSLQQGRVQIPFRSARQLDALIKRLRGLRHTSSASEEELDQSEDLTV